MERTSRMDKKFILTAFLICVLYLILRFSFPETVEFGYDQPRLATRVVEFINNGNLFETQKFAEKAPWGNISWGPALFYFYAPFFILTKNPLEASYLIALFNLISIVGVITIGSRVISKKAGLFAGLILATSPWWIIFSRMIYQPAPIVSLVVASMYLFFKSTKNINSIFYSLLIFSWIFLIEVYSHTVSFVVLSSLMIIIYSRKKLFNKFLFIGLVLSTVLIIPFFVDFNKDDYLPAKPINTEDNFTVGRDDPIVRSKVIVPGFIQTLSGGSMEYQLGYSFEEFNTTNPMFVKLLPIVMFSVIFVLSFHFIKLIASKDLRFERLTLLLWSLSPLLFLIFIPLPNVPPIPRYFLVAFPAVALLFGMLFSEVYKLSKFVVVLLSIPMVWVCFIYSYSQFIKNYDFKSGHLSVYSDTQYLFLFDAIKTARFDNFLQGRAKLVLTNDETMPKDFALDWATKFVWDNVFKESSVKEDYNYGYYLIDYSFNKEDTRFSKVGRHGPYTVYRFVE